MRAAAKRLFLLVLLVALGFGPIGAAAQDAGRIYRLGFLAAGGSAANRNVVDAFRDGLRELGCTEGLNITIEYRFAEGRFDRLPSLADELVGASTSTSSLSIFNCFTRPSRLLATSRSCGIHAIPVTSLPYGT